MRLDDRKGDTLNYPKAVLALPFSEVGSTAGGQYADDYATVCGEADADVGGAPVGLLLASLLLGSGAAGPNLMPAWMALRPCVQGAFGGRAARCTHAFRQAPEPAHPSNAPQDVVYYFKPTADVTVTASLCGSSTLPSTFDARLYLLAGVDSGGMLQAAACSNNACGFLPSLTVRGGQAGHGALQDACWCGMLRWPSDRLHEILAPLGPHAGFLASGRWLCVCGGWCGGGLWCLQL